MKKTNNIIKSKTFRVNKRICKAELIKKDKLYIVKVGKEVYAKTANELFAVQVFNEI